MHNISLGYQVSGSGVGLFGVEMEVLVVGGGGDVDDVEGSVMAPDGGKGAYLSAAASELRSSLDALLLPAGNVGGLAAMLSGRQEDLPSVISMDVELLSASPTRRMQGQIEEERRRGRVVVVVGREDRLGAVSKSATTVFCFKPIRVFPKVTLSPPLTTDDITIGFVSVLWIILPLSLFVFLSCTIQHLYTFT